MDQVIEENLPDDHVVTGVDVDGVGPITVGFADLPAGAVSVWRSDWRILILDRGLSLTERISTMGRWAYELKGGSTAPMHCGLAFALALGANVNL